MKRAGFTMIELIFVIVILGILAAVAVPKLAATRSDAEATAALSDYKSAIKAVTGAALASGTIPTISTVFPSVGNVATTGTTIVVSLGTGPTTCLTATINGNDLNITIGSVAGDCVVFAGTVAEGYPLLGSTVVR